MPALLTRMAGPPRVSFASIIAVMAARLAHVCIEKTSIAPASRIVRTRRLPAHESQDRAPRDEHQPESSARWPIPWMDPGHQRCPTLKKAFLHENHYSITSSAQASR